MNEYNQRQYQQMLYSLDQYEKGAVSIGGLISSLEGLLNALENLPSSWKDTFLRFWGKLEEARAVALSRGSLTLNDVENKVVESGIAQLKLLVLNQVEDPADR